MAESAPGGLPALAARFGAALHDAGLPVGPGRTERFARAILLARPRRTRELYWCALATLISDPSQVAVLDRVFATVFGSAGLDRVTELDGIDQRGDPYSARLPDAAPRGPSTAQAAAGQSPTVGEGREGEPAELPVAIRASDAERLAGRDFSELTAGELALLAEAMGRFRVATPLRRSRRTQRAAHGHLVDLRSSLRHARRTAGEPVTVARRRLSTRPRRLVVLCDISGSMEPYARALLQLLYCAGGGARAEVFTFATRLTRLTPALRRLPPAAALRRAGELAPDWSGGTRIGEAVKEFNDGYGCRGLARGAVVLIISDGWETGDSDQLGAEMARLRRVAHRIVWANPRTKSEQFRPLVGGMAAAWPYCDAVVSGHRLAAIDDLLAALAGPAR